MLELVFERELQAEAAGDLAGAAYVGDRIIGRRCARTDRAHHHAAAERDGVLYVGIERVNQIAYALHQLLTVTIEKWRPLAARAGVPHVVLTHLIPPPDKPGDADAFERDVRDGGYEGRITVGTDLASVVI